MYTAVLIGWDFRTLPPPPHLNSYARALLVSQDRRHLFVTPCFPVMSIPLLFLHFCPFLSPILSCFLFCACVSSLQSPKTFMECVFFFFISNPPLQWEAILTHVKYDILPCWIALRESSLHAGEQMMLRFDWEKDCWLTPYSIYFLYMNMV